MNREHVMFMENKNPAAGFTLIELMIAIAISGIISSAAYSVFQAQTRGMVSQDISLQMTQSVRAAMEIIASDIRMAGCDPTETANAGIENADVSDLFLSMDFGDGAQGPADGDLDDPNEQVRYAINEVGHLGRATGTSSPLNTMHSIDLVCDSLVFIYLADDGPDVGHDPDVLPAPVTADMDDIRAIQVYIRVHWSAKPERWFDLTQTIACRNL